MIFKTTKKKYLVKKDSKNFIKLKKLTTTTVILPAITMTATYVSKKSKL